MRVLLEAVQFVSMVSFVSGLFLKSLLFYLIKRLSTKELGTYKYLLEIFTAYDLYLLMARHLINPQPISSPSAWAVVSDRDFGFYALFPFLSSCYTVPFVILNIHLLYRYWTIATLHKIALFSHSRFIGLIIANTAILQLTWFIGSFKGGHLQDTNDIQRYQQLFYHEFQRHIHGGIFVAEFWKGDELVLRSLIMFISGSFSEIASFAIAATLALLTFRKIRKSGQISEKSRSFQQQILVAACAQTLTPTIFVHIPYFLSLAVPFLGLNSPSFCSLTHLLISLFPCLDAIVLVALMKPYRAGLTGMIRRRTVQNIVNPASSQMTSIAHPVNVPK